ncbi:MAG: hypothetical protein AAB281_06265, partial [Actinomycetota bacterium]
TADGSNLTELAKNAAASSGYLHGARQGAVGVNQAPELPQPDVRTGGMRQPQQFNPKYEIKLMFVENSVGCPFPGDCAPGSGPGIGARNSMHLPTFNNMLLCRLFV